MEKDEFLYPRSYYRGKFSPEAMIFNANLQEFSTKVGYITALETGGKITPEDAYRQIKSLFKILKQSKKSLSISDNQPKSD